MRRVRRSFIYFLFYLSPEIIVQEGERVFMILTSNAVLLGVVTVTPLMEGTTIIIIIRHELGLDRPVVASSNSLFKGLPSRLRPFGV